RRCDARRAPSRSPSASTPLFRSVYGGTGKAARNQQCLDAIIASLKALENDETLLVQSGKPVGIFKTHEYAPRGLIANSNLVGHRSEEHTSELQSPCNLVCRLLHAKTHRRDNFRYAAQLPRHARSQLKPPTVRSNITRMRHTI